MTFSLTENEQRKSITVRFIGGPRDGEVLTSTLENRKDLNECIVLYLMHSNHGQVGTRTSGLTEGGRTAVQQFLSTAVTHPDGNITFEGEKPAANQHFYEVTDRQEDDTSINVMYTYLGAVQN